MDRIKEEAEQAAFDSRNHRRFVRSLLREYIEARVDYERSSLSLVRSFAVMRIIYCRVTLRGMGYNRFAMLRNYAKRIW